MKNLTDQQIESEIDAWSQAIQNRHEKNLEATFEKRVVDQLQSEKTKRSKIKNGYVAAVDLWNEETQNDVISGKLKLRRGQWVKCGDAKLSRFVCVHGGGLWVVHPEGNPEGTRRITSKRFTEICEAASGRALARKLRKGEK